MLQIKNIEKRYVTGDLVQTALGGVSTAFRDNEFVAILGPSGSGKTTLLNIIGGLDRYDSGDLIINGISTKQYNDRDWDSYRNHTIGFIFQSYNLIPHQTILANVELGMTISGISKSERRKRAKEALGKVGLAAQLHKKPNQMSGGQMQRVAIARALANDPDILLADEPTGALDSETSVQIMNLLAEVAKNKLVIMVTHNPELAEQYATRIISVKDGRIEGDTNPFHVDINTSNNAVHKNMGKSSMSIGTALGLSFNNLKTKKARTFITAFAGSIGIIGIALILSLSNGVQTYIDNIQKDAMMSYPIKLDKESYDMTAIMSSMQSKKDDAIDSINNDDRTDAIYVDQSRVEVSNLFKAKENDLAAFKKYLDDPNCELLDYVGENGIIYSYKIKFGLYTFDDEGVFINTDGSALNSSSTSSPFAQFFSGYNDSDVCAEELLVGQNGDTISHVIQDNYDIVYGRLPEDYDELVLVANIDNSVSMNTLYQLGLLPLSEYDDIQEQLSNGDTVEVDKNKKISYQDICNHEFYLVPRCDYFLPNKDNKLSNNDAKYEDISTDNNKVKEELIEKDKCIKMKITGIIKLNKDSNAMFITQPLGYTRKLTDYLIDYTLNNSLVEEQMKDESINVINGLEFESKSRNEKRKLAKEYLEGLSDSEKAILYQGLVMVGQIEDDSKEESSEETTTTEEAKTQSVNFFDSVFNTKTVYAEELSDINVELFDESTDSSEMTVEVESLVQEIHEQVEESMSEIPEESTEFVGEVILDTTEFTYDITTETTTEAMTEQVSEIVESKEIVNVKNYLYVTKSPDKMAYNAGEGLNLDGGYLRDITIIKYKDNTYDFTDEYKPITDDSYVIDSHLFNVDKIGIYPITIYKHFIDETTGKDYESHVNIYVYVVSSGESDSKNTLFGYTPEQLEAYAMAIREGVLGQKDENGNGTVFGITPERLEEYASALRNGLIGDNLVSGGIDFNINFGINDLGQIMNALQGFGNSGLGSLMSGSSDISGLMSGLMGGSTDSSSTDLSGLLSGMSSGTNSNLSEDQLKAMMSGGELSEDQLKDMMSGYDSQMSNSNMGNLSEEQLKALMGDNSMMGMLDSSMSDLFSMYGMSEEELVEKMNNFIDNPDDDTLLFIYDNYIASGSYEDNLALFGVVDREDPYSISIYADSFESKDSISKCIENYNNKVDEDKQISYTDYVALLMSSITTIINVISYILIAFVAVSLVVSSIMIGIITYISVLERTKEIGILRALGSSKKNISQVFNAETFIIGLCSGLLGIITTELIILPTNLILHAITNMDDVSAILPINGSIVLVVLSVFLTLIGGFIPAKKAAKKDPVLALRTD